ncbi:MAG: TlpA disulfide reductase family protein, partial [Candidatus Competibacteraceae bacterium]|nr:TlpA disulfide reductase family protein [Candidatus Competibacteraceae bacterium]
MSEKLRALWLALLLVPTLAWATQTVDFQLPGLDGQPVKLSDYRGRWVVLNFWATWCPPCLEEMPELEAFHRSDSAVVVGVNFETVDREVLADFVADLAISYP